ncbi:MAG: energy-coupling factor transporter ATPase, partial [Ktedonobacteraceae bacterium]
ALALRPRCIIADEATAQLDPLSRQEIVALLHQLNRAYGLTIMHVTHLLEETVKADRIVIMQQGRAVLESTPTAIFSDLERLRRFRLIIPEPIALAARLREIGFAIAPDALTVEAIAQEILH